VIAHDLAHERQAQAGSLLAGREEGVKIFSRSSGGTPGPSSRTSMRTRSPRASAPIAT
jgi:hypothetical protein